MLQDSKKRLFTIGIAVVVFALTFLIEHLFSVDTEITGFVKGFCIGLLIAVVISFIPKKKKNESY